MIHFPVLLNESIDALKIRSNGIYIDATFGRGGHSKAILKQLDSSKGMLIAFDKDLEAIEYAYENFISYPNFKIVHSSFANIYEYCLNNDLIGKVNGLIMDLGVSSPQLDNAARGFSFNKEGPLDMRIDISQGKTAAHYLHDLGVNKLASIFKIYGEERFSIKIAQRIKNYITKNNKINSTIVLADLIRDVIGNKEKKNPATRCFQALRIYVNNELNDLENLLANILEFIKPGGRVSAISFHSLENRIVKHKFSECTIPKRFNNRIDQLLPEDYSYIKAKWIIKKTRASQTEIKQNFRSRSAILRVIEKL